MRETRSHHYSIGPIWKSMVINSVNYCWRWVSSVMRFLLWQKRQFTMPPHCFMCQVNDEREKPIATVHIITQLPNNQSIRIRTHCLVLQPTGMGWGGRPSIWWTDYLADRFFIYSLLQHSHSTHGITCFGLPWDVQESCSSIPRRCLLFSQRTQEESPDENIRHHICAHTPHLIIAVNMACVRRATSFTRLATEPMDVDVLYSDPPSSSS